ncbi:hypothetical protein MRX96_034169 [Rhipicephalus microplus]
MCRHFGAWSLQIGSAQCTVDRAIASHIVQAKASGQPLPRANRRRTATSTRRIIWRTFRTTGNCEAEVADVAAPKYWLIIKLKVGKTSSGLSTRVNDEGLSVPRS